MANLKILSASVSVCHNQMVSVRLLLQRAHTRESHVTDLVD